MAKMAITDQYLTDIADAIRSKTGISSKTYYPSEMAPAILSISGSGGIIPTGTINITSNNTYDVTQYASANVNVPNPSTGTLTITANDTYDVTNYASAVVDVPTGSTINNQNKSVTPSESQQTVNADAGYTGLGTVTVGAIDSDYVGSGISRKDSTSLTVSGATVTAPAGYYANSASKSLPNADPWIEIEDGFFTDSGVRKFRYRGNVMVEESEGDTAGYLPDGYSKSSEWSVLNAIPANTTVTPTKSAQTIGNMGTIMEGAVTIAAVPEMDFWEGFIQRNNYETINGQRYWKPTCGIQAFTSGWLDAGTYGEVDTFPAVAANTTITPTTSAQTIGGANTMMEGAVTVAAMPTGTAGTPTATKGTVSDNSISITPSVTNTTGYITGGTKTGTAVSVSASELVSGTLSITSNGTKDVTNYATVSVNVPSSGITPSGNIDITQAGVTDVTNYATATVSEVDVSAHHSFTYSTSNNQRKCSIEAWSSIDEPGFVEEGSFVALDDIFNAVAANTTITPTTSTQTIGGADWIMEGPLTIAAMPSGSATAPASISGTSASFDGGTNALTFTKTISVTPEVTAGYVSSGTSRNVTVSLSADIPLRGQNDLTFTNGRVTYPAGFYEQSGYKDLPTGVTTSPTSISGTAATVSTGTNTLTLTKTVSVTPRVTTAGYVSAGTAGNSSVSLTANITTKAAATITPSTSNQTIASGTYLIGTQTISGDANLIADNIKSGTTIFGVTGTYEGSGSGSSMTVATTTKTLTSAASSIQFTGLAGEPTSFAVVSASDLTTGASPWKTAAVVFDGSSLHGQTITNTSNAQVSYDGTGFSKTYSNGTLTITGTNTNFQANQYKLVYTYGGSVSNIGTSDVQVGSGVTSITFTGIESEPEYFSCIFKSNFSTSNGYQRVIVVVYDGTSIYGMQMDSSAKANTTNWSYSYNNNSLVITSSGTNAGGYFHQPGYYQLTYALPGADDGLQTKTVTPTTSVQNVTADTGYTGLKKVVVNAIPSTYIQPTATKGATIYTPGTSNQTIASGTYLTGTQTIMGDADLIAGNIKAGTNIFNVSGTFTSDATAAASDIVNGETAYVNGSKVTGTLVLQTVYTGSSAPSSSTGVNGDIYIQS